MRRIIFNFLYHAKLIFTTNTTASLYCNKSDKRDALNSIYTCHKVNMLYYVFYKVIITFLRPNHRATWFHAGFFRNILIIPKSHQKKVNISQWSHIEYDQQVLLLSHILHFQFLFLQLLPNPLKPANCDITY